MLSTERGRYIMSDAWAMYADAIEMLAQERIRNAADKAWCATKRATDALILERTGREPEITTQTSAGIRALGRQSEAGKSLHSRYTDRISQLAWRLLLQRALRAGGVFRGANPRNRRLHP